MLSKSITLEESLIDIKSLATNAKVSFIEEEVKDIDFNLREIILSNRPSVNYSKLVLNYGSQTIIPKEFESLVKNRNAFVKSTSRFIDLIPDFSKRSLSHLGDNFYPLTPSIKVIV